VLAIAQLINTLLGPARPEEMRSVDHTAALVRLAEQLGGSESTL